MAACLTLLDRNYLPRLRAVAYQPADTLADPHFACDGAIHAVETWETYFPFDCPDMHHALRHLTREELHEAADDERYEIRTEAAIELAHRLGGRPLATMVGAAVQKADPRDAARLLHVVMTRDPRTGRALGLGLLGHPDWRVRLVAAGAVLNAAR